MRAAIAGGAVSAALLGTAGAQPAPGFVRAAELYKQATDELAAGHYADAVRDLTAAYDLAHDPVLLFKIGEANDKAGNCPDAIAGYRRYLTEGTPDPPSAAVAEDRIRACGGEPPIFGGAPPLPPIARPGRPHGTNAAWLMVGGAIAFLTTGAVLAYSASSSEQDLKDLYAGIDGRIPAFDVTTQQRYNELIDEGHRYEDLSWISFGLAGACATAATLLFLRGGGTERATVAPLAAPHTGGLTATLRF
jgi:hypothetical protein